MACSVLVVEDDDALRRVLELRLGMLGYAVTSCANGLEAIDLCFEQGRDFDVVLLDWRMPLMDGLETAKRLRADPRTRNWPIVCVTAEISAADVQAAGVFDYHLGKPFTREELREIMTSVTDDIAHR